MKPFIRREAIRENLECAICLEEFKDPRSLQCGHLFCLECVKKLERRNKKVTCPECRDKTVVSVGDGGLNKKLPQISTVSRIQRSLNDADDMKKFGIFCTACYNQDSKTFVFCNVCKILCEKCAAIHRESETYQEHSISQLDEKYICPEHHESIMDMICLSCKEPICKSCIMKSHPSHEVIELDRYLAETRSKCQSIRDDALLQSYQMGKLSRVKDRLQKEHDAWEKTCEEFIRSLDEMKSIVIEEKTTKFALYGIEMNKAEMIEKQWHERKFLSEKAGKILEETSSDVNQKVKDYCEMRSIIEQQTQLKNNNAYHELNIPIYVTAELQAFRGKSVQFSKRLSGSSEKPVTRSPETKLPGENKPHTEVRPLKNHKGKPIRTQSTDTSLDFVLDDPFNAGAPSYRSRGSIHLSLNLCSQRSAEKFSSFYGMALDKYRQAVVIYSLPSDDHDEPILFNAYDGQDFYIFGPSNYKGLSGKEGLNAAGLFVDKHSNFSICFDSTREFYVVTKKEGGKSGSLLKFNETNQRTLRIKGDFDITGNVVYCEEKDCYAFACTSDIGSQILMVHPKKGTIMDTIGINISLETDINIGRFEEKDVFVYLEKGTNGSQDLRVIDMSGLLVRSRTVDRTIVSAEMGPGGIVFLRHKAKKHLSYICVKLQNPSKNEAVTVIPLLENMESIMISCVRYDCRNNVLAVGVTDTKSHHDREPDDGNPVSNVFMFDVIIINT